MRIQGQGQGEIMGPRRWARLCLYMVVMESGLARLVRARGMLHSWLSTLRAMLRILAWGLCPAGACPHAYPETSKHLPVGLSKYLLPTDQNGPLLLTPLIETKCEADSALADQGLQAKKLGERGCSQETGPEKCLVLFLQGHLGVRVGVGVGLSRQSLGVRRSRALPLLQSASFCLPLGQHSEV
jgi:hypothetical protein